MEENTGEGRWEEIRIEGKRREEKRTSDNFRVNCPV
jgi:hypothetical protein